MVQQPLRVQHRRRRGPPPPRPLVHALLARARRRRTRRRQGLRLQPRRSARQRPHRPLHLPARPALHRPPRPRRRRRVLRPAPALPPGRAARLQPHRLRHDLPARLRPRDRYRGARPPGHRRMAGGPRRAGHHLRLPRALLYRHLRRAVLRAQRRRRPERSGNHRPRGIRQPRPRLRPRLRAGRADRRTALVVEPSPARHQRGGQTRPGGDRHLLAEGGRDLQLPARRLQPPHPPRRMAAPARRRGHRRGALGGRAPPRGRHRPPPGVCRALARRPRGHDHSRPRHQRPVGGPAPARRAETAAAVRKNPPARENLLPRSRAGHDAAGSLALTGALRAAAARPHRNRALRRGDPRPARPLRRADQPRPLPAAK